MIADSQANRNSSLSLIASPCHRSRDIKSAGHSAWSDINGGEGVSWRGAKSHEIITFYDKSRQMSSSVLRAEVSLRVEQLRSHLPGDTWRSFDHLYRKYRELLASIPPIKSPVKADNFQEAIAPELPEIRNRILARLAHKPKRTYRHYKQQVETAAAQIEQTFSWAEILPKNAPPLAVHVAARNSRQRRPAGSKERPLDA